MDKTKSCRTCDKHIPDRKDYVICPTCRPARDKLQNEFNNAKRGGKSDEEIERLWSQLSRYKNKYKDATCGSTSIRTSSRKRLVHALKGRRTEVVPLSLLSLSL